MLGLPDFEAAQAGAVWRFRNEGNRASFVAHPEIYGPQFGGYDPVDVARGVTLAGNPRFFAVVGQRLYLFGIEAHRDAFAAHPEHYLPEARERWPRSKRCSLNSEFAALFAGIAVRRLFANRAGRWQFAAPQCIKPERPS